MIRFVLYVLAAIGLAIGGWWLAAQTGLVMIEAFHREIRLSLPVGLAAIGLFSFLLFLFWNMFAWVLGLPSRVRKMRQMARRERGYDALERALIASAAGDTKGARKHAQKVKSLMDRPALAGLLAARSAQADGDIVGAERHFEALLEDKRTELAARRGLTETALQRHDPDAAIAHAAAAFASEPTAKWAFEALFDAQVRAHAWKDARATAEMGQKKKHLSKQIAARRRCVLLAAEAGIAEIENDLELAIKLAEQAVSAAPDFAPAAALAARLLVAADKHWRAAGLLEDAWAGAPHPALSLAYRDLKEDETPKARAKRMNGLAQIKPAHRESKIVLAETALDMDNTAKARQILDELIKSETDISSRLCMIMARLEKADKQEDAAQNWLRRSFGAPDEANWSDLDPEGPAFGYRAEDWARLVYSFGDEGELIHPRHERFERIGRGDEHLMLLEQDKKEKDAPTETTSKQQKDAPAGPARQPDDPGPAAKADPVDSPVKRKRNVH